MNKSAEALRLEKLARHYCERGLHVQAADCFDRASVLYGELGEWYASGYCRGQATGERRAMRPAMPVNRSALVD